MHREDAAEPAPEAAHAFEAEDAPAHDADAPHDEGSEAALEGTDETEHETNGDHEVAAEVNHSVSTWFQPEHAAGSDAELAAPVDDEPADVTEHDSSVGSRAHA